MRILEGERESNKVLYLLENSPYSCRDLGTYPIARRIPKPLYFTGRHLGEYSLISYLYKVLCFGL